ncbi:hypothetical protein B0F90DRAFT_1813755 [Multifurca ochricompacta]|uniref:RRM domain-containing protein n=1 Tax=Multifurca ochricompacta TaxID=376703 RepID=A0AAD4MAP5_9AGAM|nr:hypothetical protein B0F90DRAFT_1813755 [Multifurca ochricompacta]
MSRRDVTGPEFPPNSATYEPQRILTLSPSKPSSPRSFGMQGQDYGISINHIDPNAWSSPLAGTNSRIPNLPLQLHHPNPLPPPRPHLSSSPPNSGSAGFQTFDSIRNGLHLQLTYTERDPHSLPASQATVNPSSQSQFVYSSSAAAPPSSTSPLTPSSLWWGELEPWMDEEYAKQVCGLMGWDPISIKVPHPPPDSLTGQQANNPGYCFLTFPTPAHAASVLAQINNNGSGTPITMPNSNKPFLLNWASSTPIPPSLPPPGFTTQQQQHAKEYSIFVGDLAPEASNSDLVAVFRNPVLGLRNDREPKFIRPFLSCKSAKIMLDPVTGVSRGYGFVRFTDEADQQRALIEMHGLYCLSRPMRISPATAKYKAAPTEDLPQVQIPPQSIAPYSATHALPLPVVAPTNSISSPIVGASTGATSSSNSLSSSGMSSSASSSSVSAPSLSSGPSTSGSSSTLASTDSNERQQNVLTQYANSTPSSKPISDAPTSITSPFARQGAGMEQTRYSLVEESWKHQAQARAILSNLIGPNGEQLTSTDPYNTTVFVGGLSPLISEETLRTFFAPFGDIHYVKVPVGKHCGFVQFVRKADAERAIEKMQGFPIGGSRIRLSWGRSQYKAAQAAAQAAQAAALQAHLQSQMITPRGTPITMEQTVQLLQQMQLQGFFNPVANGDQQGQQNQAQGHPQPTGSLNDGSLRNVVFSTRDLDGASPFSLQPSGGYGDVRTPRAGLSTTSFSPFSPDPNLFSGSSGSAPKKPEPLLHHPPSSTGFAQGFGSGPAVPHDASNNLGANGPVTMPRYTMYYEKSAAATISRPPSGSLNMVSHPERREYFEIPEHEHDAITDLNGTLASLDLDSAYHHQSSSASVMASTPVAWKRPSSSSPPA